MRSAGGQPSWLGGSGSSVVMASSNVEDATKVGRDAWSWASAADAWRASAWALGVRSRRCGVSNAGPDMWCWLGWDGVEMREAFIAAAWLLAARAAVTPLHSAVVRSRGGRASEGLVVPPVGVSCVVVGTQEAGVGAADGAGVGTRWVAEACASPALDRVGCPAGPSRRKRKERLVKSRRRWRGLGADHSCSWGHDLLSVE